MRDPINSDLLYSCGHVSEDVYIQRKRSAYMYTVIVVVSFTTLLKYTVGIKAFTYF